MQFTITAVVVSYNREALLQECLDGIAAQTRPVDRVVVVDNASTDHALAVARAHPLIADATPSAAMVVELPRNVGGAGGFCAGMAEALAMMEEHSHDTSDDSPSYHYIWLMDDDTVPTPTALEALLEAVDCCIDANHALPAVLGSKAVWVDGREHLMNKPRERTWIRKGVRHLPDAGTPDEPAYQVRSLSFVSCLINAGAVLHQHKLPRSAYFLWNDDYEFTTALLRHGIGYYVPSSQVVHKTRVFGSSDADPGKRFYNEVRNKLWLLRFSRDNFSAAELVEFLLKTVRRWVLTWMRAKDRALIDDCLRRGWHDGIRTNPMSNADVFRDVPNVAKAITAVEG